jgi:hypothetical protein
MNFIKYAAVIRRKLVSISAMIFANVQRSFVRDSCANKIFMSCSGQTC